MRFVSKFPKLEMTMKAEILREINGVVIKEPTKKIKFVNCEYITEDKDEIAFIKRYIEKNVDITIDESEKYQKQEPTPEEKIIIEKATKRGRPKKG